jgi:hypothetical protein
LASSHLLTGLAINSTVRDNCSDTYYGFDITSESGFDRLRNCSTVNGNIFYSDITATVFTLPPAIKYLNGSLSFWQLPLLKSIQAPGLTAINGTLDFVELPALSTVSMPLLRDVGGLGLSYFESLNTSSWQLNFSVSHGGCDIAYTNLTFIPNFFSLVSVDFLTIRKPFSRAV